MRLVFAIVLLASACLACSRVPPLPVPLDQPAFIPTGRITLTRTGRFSTAEFDDDRVIGPLVDVARNADGSWSGFLQNRAIKVEVDSSGIDSPSLSLKISLLPESGLEIRGVWSRGGVRDALQIHIRRSGEDLFVVTPTSPRALLFLRRGLGRYRSDIGSADLVLSGAAALPVPPEPQFAFALLGTL